MPIPSHESLMLPILKMVSDKKIHKFTDVVDSMAKQFNITPDELRVLLPSGRYPMFRSRVGWAKTYLSKALLLDMPVRGSMKITQRGLDLFNQNVQVVNTKSLLKYAEFQKFHKGSTTESVLADTPVVAANTILNSTPAESTPIETIENAFAKLKQSLIEEILSQLKVNSPTFFENVVIDLLVAMGYGGDRADAAKIVGGPHDGGIDGIINQDRLGLDVVYVQAKRWSGTTPVSRPDIQSFAGALQTHHANKGVYITTGRFAEPAKQYVKGISSKIILIDGEQLARYMIEFGIGVAVKDTYKLKTLDLDYFAED